MNSNSSSSFESWNSETSLETNSPRQTLVGTTKERTEESKSMSGKELTNLAELFWNS